MMKLLNIFQNLISFFKIKFTIKGNIKKKIIIQNLQSNVLEKKLALLVKDIDIVTHADLKHFEYKKMNGETKKNLFTSYRLDFHDRDELNKFKKKYKTLLL